MTKATISPEYSFTREYAGSGRERTPQACLLNSGVRRVEGCVTENQDDL